jgi:hypothetical protein
MRLDPRPGLILGPGPRRAKWRSGACLLTPLYKSNNRLSRFERRGTVTRGGGPASKVATATVAG